MHCKFSLFDPHFRCCPPSAGCLSSQARRCFCLSLVTSGGVSGRRQHSLSLLLAWIARVSAPDLLRQIIPPTLINSKQIGAHRAAVHIHLHHTLSLLVLLVLLRLLLLLAANARLVFLSLPLLRVTTALSPLLPAARLPFRRLTTCLPSPSCVVRLTRKSMQTTLRLPTMLAFATYRDSGCWAGYCGCPLASLSTTTANYRVHPPGIIHLPLPNISSSHHIHHSSRRRWKFSLAEKAHHTR